jgi:mRNA interferase MazF
MKRREVWRAKFNTLSVGGEIEKQRRAVIVSNDASNKLLNRLQVVTRTSTIDKLYPCEAYVMICGKQSKAIADQLTTVSKLRLTNMEGKLSVADLQKVERAVRTQLDL